MTRRLLTMGAFLLAATVAGQEALGPKFEVVSIHVVPPNAPPVMREIGFTSILPGGQYIDSRTALLFMVAIAYEVRNTAVQLEGLPKWAQTQSFSVVAKAGSAFPQLSPAENVAQVRLMLRAMLADRFHLQIHSEIRQEKIFQLEVAKGGQRMKEADPPEPPAGPTPVGAAMGDDGGRLIGNKSTMAGLVLTLPTFSEAPRDR